ncbi:MAG: 4Fe-4S dicluster domain-containing protein [Anaerolineae bacterium]
MNAVSEGRKQTLSRKKFLQAGLAGTVLIAVGGKLVTLEQALAEAKAQYALVIDLNKCTGCRACELACHQRNELPGEMSYIKVFPKKMPDGTPYFLPVQCQHCEKPPCASVCPTGATYHHESGTVLVNHKTCVGCRYCMVACPYDARRYDEEKGIAEKCWLCLDWVLGGGEPACVQACAPGARIFGRRDDPNSEVAQLIASGRAKPLHPEFGTQPGILFYIFPGE